MTEANKERRKSGNITADYDAEATFEKGNATIHLTLIKHGDNWQIMGFHVNSSALAPRSPETDLAIALRLSSRISASPFSACQFFPRLTEVDDIIQLLARGRESLYLSLANSAWACFTQPGSLFSAMTLLNASTASFFSPAMLWTTPTLIHTSESSGTSWRARS